MLGADDDAATRGLARSGERRDRRGRGGVLDMAVPAAGQPEQLRGPVQRQTLELRRGGRRPPQERNRVEGRGEQLGEDPRLPGAHREVREEAWALPMRNPGQEDLVEVSEHVRERLAAFGRRRRQTRTDGAGLDLCENRKIADPFEIPRSPVERGGAVFPEAHLRSFWI